MNTETPEFQFIKYEIRKMLKKCVELGYQPDQCLKSLVSQSTAGGVVSGRTKSQFIELVNKHWDEHEKVYRNTLGI